MSRLLRALLAGALALLLGGCPLFPRQAELEQIHDTYRSEFASTFLGNAKAMSAFCSSRDAMHTDMFPKTLQAIRDYDVKYQSDSATSVERAHLTVLKAMIHLQVGNTGIARSMIGDVEKAQISAAGDREVRDLLFQKAFPYLVDGWAEVCEGDPKQHEARLDRLVKAANGVVKISNDAAARKDTAGKPVADEGAIYLATTGAIFYRHAFQERVDLCLADQPLGGAKRDRETCYRSAAKEDDLKKGAEAIGKFLSPEETRAAAGAAPGAVWERVVPRGRMQYVQWYVLLSGEQAKYR